MQLNVGPHFMQMQDSDALRLPLQLNHLHALQHVERLGLHADVLDVFFVLPPRLHTLTIFSAPVMPVIKHIPTLLRRISSMRNQAPAFKTLYHHVLQCHREHLLLWQAMALLLLSITTCED